MTTTARQTTAIHWYTDVAEAQRVARELRRPMLIDFWDPECLGCRKMLDVTFPDPTVAGILAEEFVALKIDTTALTSPQRALIRAYRVLWTPDLLFVDHMGAEITRRIGYHAPPEFASLLHVVAGQEAMVNQGYAAAFDHFAAAAAVNDAIHTRPEALFWAGIAAYKDAGTGDRAILRRHWRVLESDFADTPWWERALASWGVEDPAETTLLHA